MEGVSHVFLTLMGPESYHSSLRKVMQEKTEAAGARIEKDTGCGRAALYRREERVDRRRVACRRGASRSRGPAVSGYGQGRKDRSPTAAVEAHPAPAPETSAPPARGGGAPMGVGNRSKEEVRGESLLGSYDIHAGGVPKPAQKLFAVLPRQTERPHVGHPQTRDHIANVVEVRLFERPFHHRRFCPGDKIRTREVMTQVCGELIRYHLTSDFTHYI